MDLSSTSLFSLMKSKLDYTGQRHGELAKNVANADTPRYKARDVQAPDFHKLAVSMSAAGTGQKLRMARTDGQHLTGAAASQGHYRAMTRKTTNELNPDGNNVALDEEMAKLADNQGDYEKTLDLYSSEVAMFKTAIDSANTGG